MRSLTLGDEMTALQEFTRGWRAAERGEPLELHHTADWRAGYEGFGRRYAPVPGVTLCPHLCELRSRRARVT